MRRPHRVKTPIDFGASCEKRPQNTSKISMGQMLAIRGERLGPRLTFRGCADYVLIADAALRHTAPCRRSLQACSGALQDLLAALGAAKKLLCLRVCEAHALKEPVRSCSRVSLRMRGSVHVANHAVHARGRNDSLLSTHISYIRFLECLHVLTDTQVGAIDAFDG